LIFYWIYAISVIYSAWKRLHQGLSETLRMRLRVLNSVTTYVIAIIIYWGITWCVYVPYLALSNPSIWIVQLMNFMITCKGYFDFVVWFQLNEFTPVFSNDPTSSTRRKDVDIDIDLSPQVNLALRCEILYYTTTGIIQAVRDTQYLPPGANQQELYLQPQGTEDNRGSLGGVEEEYVTQNTPHRYQHRQRQHLSNVATGTISSATANGGGRGGNDGGGNVGRRRRRRMKKNKGTLFIDYCPHTFQTIREHFGIETNQYIESLSRTTKERLSEGASGAFMFFSFDQQLIVKSMSTEESIFLRNIAADYASYLLTNPDSLLTRFYGCHAIRLYGNTFHFVVMANLFNTDKTIHRRYDIKGSWVNRTAKYPSKGKRVTCRHCNGKYVFGSSDAAHCPARVGRHEPNMVLKDNDMTARVRLHPVIAEELYVQLVKDANFLSRLGIMDYSLLLGVHNVEYIVNPELHEEEEEEEKEATTISNSNNSTRNELRHRFNGTQKQQPPPPPPPAPPSSYSFSSIPVSAATAAPTIGSRIPRNNTGLHRANTVVGPSLYYFGLIDILQTWNLNKKLERFTKLYLLRKDPDGLSAIPPTAYCDRFKKKMAEMLSIRLEYDEIEQKEEELEEEKEKEKEEEEEEEGKGALLQVGYDSIINITTDTNTKNSCTSGSKENTYNPNGSFSTMQQPTTHFL
jgi:1-phosphatidylinositol-4-phosphate 5-kinase